MQIIHRISVLSTPEVQEELSCMGIIVGEGLVTFEVDESHASWSELVEWIPKRDAFDLVSTTFSSDEIATAKWLELEPDWHCGYPQPEDNFGYLDATYDWVCHTCGIRAVQKAPFRMKGEPKWGRNGILQLNWVFDEFFIKPELSREVFDPLGVRCRRVLGKKGNELNNVVQLVAATDEVDADLAGHPSEKCPACARVKYLPHVRGPFPRLRNRPVGHLVRTMQFFGSGGSAHRAVLASQELVRAVFTRKIRGVSFKPVAQ